MKYHLKPTTKPAALSCVLAVLGCSHQTPVATVRSASSPPPETRAAAAVPTDRSDRVVIERPGPGCDRDEPEGFVSQPGALAAALRDVGAEAPPTGDDTVPFAEGHVQLRIPRAWFPARLEAHDFVAYRLRTNDPSDVMGLLFSDAPTFDPPPRGAFQLRANGLPIRGGLWSDQGTIHFAALVRLPCTGPRYLHAFAHVTHGVDVARLVELVRSIAWTADASYSSREVTIDATRDAAALERLTARDPLARELLRRSLSGEGAHARYSLDTQHPLADQLLTGRYFTEVAGVHAEVWVRLPVEAEGAEAPAEYRALDDGSLAHAVGALAQNGCHASAVLLTADGVGARCHGEPDMRAVVDDANDPTAWIQALDRLGRARRAIVAWNRDASLAGGWPASLCATPDGAATVQNSNGTLFVSTSTCVAVLDAQRAAIRALAVEDDCARLPAEPAWARTLRAVGRFDEVRGASGTFCRFALGWNGRNAWLIGVGDQGTSSAPIANGPTVGVDPRAVNTGVAFVHDLARVASAQTDETPANVLPSVLHALGMDHPASVDGQRTNALFAARGGFDGASVSAVLRARTVDAEHVEVTFVPLRLTLERQSGGWVVTDATPTSFSDVP